MCNSTLIYSVSLFVVDRTISVYNFITDFFSHLHAVLSCDLCAQRTSVVKLPLIDPDA